MTSQALQASSGSNLILTRSGEAEYTIVLAADASMSERHGAEELETFLEQMSGSDIKIQNESTRVPEKAILVGRGTTVDSLIGRQEFKGLGDDGFIIKAVGEKLILAGGRQRGTMYACYSLLEDVLGCRWYSDKVSFIPKKPTIRVSADINIRETPAFENRDPFHWEAFDADWAARNRSTANSSRLDEARGGKIAYYPFVHSFYGLVPPAVYFDEHPEYFSLVDGTRRRDGAQLCLTNPDVLNISIKQVFKWIEEHPEAKIISVSQNDCGGACQCPKCTEIVKREGAESGPLLEFVNAIAAEIAKKHPDKLIDTLAYQYTKDPPKTVKPAVNVRVRLCPIEACVSHPFEKCEQDKLFVDILKRWSEVTSNLYVWHYVTNFANYVQPLPNFREIEADIRMYHKAGVKGMFLQGNYQSGGNGDFTEMHAWVEAKMLWDPSRDFDALIDDFMQGYYGPAAPAIRRYFDLIHNNVLDNHIHAHIYDPPTAPYLTQDILDKSDVCFDEAASLVRFKPDYLSRVERDRLPIRYVRLCHEKNKWAEGGKNPEEGAKLWNKTRKFITDLRSYGAKHISEGRLIDTWEAAWKKELTAK